MNRNHFEALAAELKRVKPQDDTHMSTWQHCVIAVANVCAKSNIIFDRDKFYEACEADE